ncbi:MAG: hypothetical protein GX044_06120 [Firmicutes bacterium]|jgi:hypothetical protein|nr:hypothetical protein [Bacillota bacterium]
MKKMLFCFIVLAGSLVFLAGCGATTLGVLNGQPVDPSDWDPTAYETVNNLGGVTMTVEEGTVSPGGLTLRFENQSGKECVYGEHYVLEKKNDGNWYRVPVAIEEEYGFEDIGYLLPAGESAQWTVDWTWLYAKLERGDYRIVKDIYVPNDSGAYDPYYLAAEFAIK